MSDDERGAVLDDSKVTLPEQALLWIDPEVMKWLYTVADDRYAGNVEKALNVMLRVAMKVHLGPEDDWWGPLEWESSTRGGRWVRPTSEDEHPGSAG